MIIDYWTAETMPRGWFRLAVDVKGEGLDPTGRRSEALVTIANGAPVRVFGWETNAAGLVTKCRMQDPSGRTVEVSAPGPYLVMEGTEVKS